ncbi:hypothetical protein PYW08_002465 [Mythimna loreyi]|uniref:Uncharacterized protein n=1 Tax=Mythimna loreyi TaxID=667449 RepID=A0ACC2R1U5_9NEOP|nr:hypothetical protein PYW08_002465 [Mythimna loreyi]
MDSADALLGGLASGDPAAVADAPLAEPAMKRDQDSTDDFEHLDREGKREATESPQRHSAAATRSFLDMERELLTEAPRAPSASADHIADKFTDSESDADTAGESPMHRAEPRAEAGRAGYTPEPPHDPTPVLAPAPAPVLAPSAPVAPEKPLPEEPKLPATPEPVLEPPKPEPPKPEPVKTEPVLPPKSAAPEPKRQVAHVIEAEVIFCQMGLVISLFVSEVSLTRRFLRDTASFRKLEWFYLKASAEHCTPRTVKNHVCRRTMAAHTSTIYTCVLQHLNNELARFMDTRS